MEAHAQQRRQCREHRIEWQRVASVERAPTLRDYRELFTNAFGPLVAIRADLQHAPDRLAELDRRFLEALVRWNGGRDVGPVEISYEYLLVLAHRAPE